MAQRLTQQQIIEILSRGGSIAVSGSPSTDADAIGAVNPTWADVTWPNPASGANFTTANGYLNTIAARTTQVIRSALESAARAGTLYRVSTGKITLGLAGQLRVTLQNPTASGKTLIVHKITAGQSVATITWATTYHNPATNLPTTTITAKNQLFTAANSNNSSVAVFKADTHATDALSGGTTLTSFMLPGSARTDYTDVLVLQAGVTLGLNIAFVGAADTEMVFYYVEE